MRIKQMGLTLIELLFVIVLLSLLATMSISFYKINSTDVKVSKAVLQMQQILQSANAYYVDNQCWPNASNCPNNAPNFDLAYLPINSSKIPWGGVFSYAVYGQKFRVSLNFPGDLSLPQRKQLAAQLLAILPTAETNDNNNPSVLYAEIARPAKLQQNNLMIATLGVTVPMISGSQMPFNFSCPANWIGEGMAAVNSYALNVQTCPPPSSRSVGTLTAPVTCNAEANNNYSCTIQLSHTSYVNMWSNCYKAQPSTDGLFSFFYIGYCVNPALPTKQLKLF